jgi:hypothetical protein
MRERAYVVILRKKAREMDPRSQPNSSIIGLKITPKENLAPELKKRIANAEATTYHP